jgi:hypothetical protein
MQDAMQQQQWQHVRWTALLAARFLLRGLASVMLAVHIIWT